MLAFLKQILGELGRALGLLQVILGFASSSAQEDFPLEIQGIVAAIKLQVDNPTSGLNALYTQLAATQTALAVDTALILAAVGDPLQFGETVTLPLPPPGGYGGPSSGDNAAAVWAYPLNFGITAGTQQDNAGNFAARLGNDSVVVFPTAVNPLVLQMSFWNSLINAAIDYSDLAGLLISDIPLHTTVLAWANADVPTYTWALDPVGLVKGFRTAGSDDAEFWINLTQFQFDQIRALAPTVALVAPVWPGIANVTLLTPVALSAGFSITEPMDGVIVDITVPPAGRGSYSYDGVLSFQNVGSLSFFTDDGDQEFQLSLGFTSAVYCCRAMVRAAGVRVRTVPGLTGTVTPWTVNP
jgi:hypothetical protein